MATNKRTGLGRGIGSLIPTAPNAERPVDVFFPDQVATGAIPVPPQAQDVDLVEVPGARLAYISPQLVVPNPQQPRKVFNPEDLAELVHSIREIGILQPIVVRTIPDLTTMNSSWVSAACALPKRLA